MNSSNKGKTTLHGVSSHLVIALLSIFITGILLIFIGLFFDLELLRIGAVTEFYQTFVVILIIAGMILIALGVLQSLGIIKKIKKIIDFVLKSGDISITHTQAVSQPQGIGGGLKIIRPSMSTSDATFSSKPTPVSKSAPVKKATLLESPLITKTAEVHTTESVADISLEEGLQMIVDRYNDPKVSEKFSNWDETLMMSFKDLDKSYLFKINKDQGIELSEGFDEEAAVQVNLDSTIFLKMMTKQINPIKAYSSGNLEVKGKMKNLLKLRKLMF